MTVDAHHHVWDLTVRDQDWIPQQSPLRRDFTLTDLALEVAAHGVGRTVLVQTVPVADETPELLALADASALVAGVVGWTDLTHPGIAEELARLRELPGGAHLKGIRHQVQGETDPGWLRRPDVRRGLKAVADAGLVYDLLVLPHQLPSCTRAAAEHDDLVLVLDHLGKPAIASGAHDTWADDLRALAHHPNTIAKLSGLVTEAGPDWTTARLRPYVDVALEAFGPDRLMFGSDWPVCTEVASYGQVVETAGELIAAEDREQVFGATATRVYGL
ncbi:amidohydrolase family protein [Streptomyces roseirectus]|uniref:Amidohydrolase family protein n=1 Tax=Streptomyces roseirectus TaxID=2768066 RepID=A0A7H0IN10_9ACTN|nr:amidohydrolase family protein [Streptomyces roseirectus]QNP74176.1 amidohydrolase family protein [Streptomyces roseirectus]